MSEQTPLNAADAAAAIERGVTQAMPYGSVIAGAISDGVVESMPGRKEILATIEGAISGGLVDSMPSEEDTLATFQAMPVPLPLGTYIRLPGGVEEVVMMRSGGLDTVQVLTVSGAWTEVTARRPLVRHARRRPQGSAS